MNPTTSHGASENPTGLSPDSAVEAAVRSLLWALSKDTPGDV